MTRRTNARIAGIAFLTYIALGISAMVMSGRAMHGEGIAAKLATLAQHAGDMRLAVLLTLLCGFCAFILGVTLYAITRDEDQDLAMLGLVCRVAEGVAGGLSIQSSLGLLWLATATGPDAPDAQTANALGASLREGGPSVAVMFFAVGSLCFTWLLLRGQMIPIALAWLGVLSSVLWVVGYPLQLAAILPASFELAMWIPMAAFEISLAVWFIIKGVDPPVRKQAT
jgi:Domain of unknown function (DUF4386)